MGTLLGLKLMGKHTVPILTAKLRALGVDIHTHNHQMIYSVREVKVEQSGIVVE